MWIFQLFIPGIEILIIALFVYYLLSFFWNTRAMDVLYGSLAFLAFFALSKWLNLPVLEKLMFYVVNVAVLALLIIFQPEIRLSLSKLSLKTKKYREVTEFDKFLESISQSIYRLSERRIGALVVLENQDSLEDLAIKAVLINAQFSPELLESIFITTTPLHDGAVLVRGTTILSAATILITIHRPIGEVPKGYEFLDSWPIVLMQTVSGPQDQVLNLKNQGLELTFDFNEISKEQLDALQSTSPYDDEINFYIPDAWKKVSIPFLARGPVALNDPESKFLHLSFLKQQLIPLKNDLPLHVYYPLKYSDEINPNTYALAINDYVHMKNHIPILKLPLLASNVSKLFVEIVKDNLEIEIVTAPKTERRKLEWGIGFIDDSHLEDTYAAFLLSNTKSNNGYSQSKVQEREKYFRQRFRNYMQRLTLYLNSNQKLELESSLKDQEIRIKIPALSQGVPTNAS